MTEPAMQISVGVDLASLDRDFKEATKKANAVPKKITVDMKAAGVDAAGRQIDQYRGKVVGAGDGVKRLSDLSTRYDAMLGRQAQVYADMARQVETYNRAMGQQLALMNRLDVANDNNVRGVAMSGFEMANLANHVKSATVALYALSPAFRAMVNPAITASAKATSQALVAMGPAASSATLAVVRGLSPIAAAISRVLLPLSLMKTGLDLTTEAWDLGGKKLDEYRGIAEKAAAVDLSTSYFQRITKAATDAKLPVETLTAALQKMQAATMEQLGGSTLDKRLNEHLKAGNFAGNSGVAAIGQANTTEDQFKAIIKLIDEAMAKGQRLAALDIANTVFGPDITARLRQNSEYLHDLQASAEKISATQLVSDADVGRALDLQRRYDAAVAILSERWHPIQGALTALGIQMQSAWVGIVESIANAVDGAARLVMKIAEIPGSFWSYIAKGASAALPYAGAAGAVAGAALGPIGSAVGWAVGTGANLLFGNGAAKGENQLADAMKNTNNVRAAAALGLKVYDNVIKDTSKALGDHAEKQQQAANAYERAEASVMKHIARMEADRKAVGLGVGGLEELRTAAMLNAAAMQAGLPMTQALADKIQDLAQDAGDAAKALAFGNAWDRANFDKMTMGLSDLDKQIASTMKNIYGPEWQSHMDDALAKQMRMNDLLKQMHDASKSFASDFLSGLREGKSAFDSLLGAASNFATKLTNMGMDKLMAGFQSGDFAKAFGGDFSAAIGKSVSQSLDDLALKQSVAAANPANSFSFNGKAGMAGLGAIGAGLGIYAQGQQIGASGGSAGSGAMSGALSGAMSGAMLGSVIPGLGTVVGGVLGAAAGGRAGLIGDGQKRRLADNDDQHQQESKDDSDQRRRAA
jgi:hypothetical protein